MRIAFYAPLKAPDHPVPSGDRLIAGLLVRALEQAGHEVAPASRLRAFDGAGDRGRQRRLARIGREEARRLLDHWLGSPRAPRCWFTYHLYHKAPDWIGPRVSARLGIPYVVAEASYAPKQARGAWRHGHRAVAAALARAGRVIALNPDDVPGLERLLGSLENPTHDPLHDPRGLPDGVSGLERPPGGGARLCRLAPFIDTGACAPRGDRSRRRARIARTVRADPSAPLLVCVAMMRGGRKAESFRLLARALERILHVPWHLLVVGDGPARPEVEAAFAALGAAGRVAFLGLRPPPALWGIVNACDLFVWPALGEPIGMAMLEAQALGVPVVAGETRGVGEVVVHGAGGWLAPEGDAAAFAGAVEKALADPAALADAGAAARTRARAKHGLAAASRELDRWIREAVEEIRPMDYARKGAAGRDSPDAAGSPSDRPSPASR